MLCTLIFGTSTRITLFFKNKLIYVKDKKTEFKSTKDSIILFERYY